MTAFYASIGGLAQRGVLPGDFQYPFLVRGFLCVLVLAPMLGGVSHLVVTRRMAFFSAALGQAAITGVALGLLIGEPLNSPYGGMFGFCLLSTVAMVYVKRHATLPPDTLIGVFHALTLGLGLCLLVVLTRQFNVHQVESVLFGSLLTVTDGDLALLVAVGTFVAVLLVREYNHLLLDSLSPPLAKVAGAEPAYLEYFFALLLTLSIVVSLKIIGALLVEALVVVPAAAARNVARGTRGYLMWSVAVAFFAGVGGLGVSTRFVVPTGGAVVLAMSAIFFLTLAARSNPAPHTGMTAPGPATRRVEVRPPSAGAELGNVARFAMVVVMGVWMYLATDGSTFRGGGADTRHLLPFQALIQDRPSTEQRMFRELQEGLLEAETRRGDRGTWAAVSSLAGDGIPPFAVDPTAKGAQYDWRLMANGTLVNYLGLPQRPDAPAWLVLVQEPEPGAPPDPAREDEEHHRLITGDMLHVSTWVRADARVAGRITRTPQAEGWTQLYAVGPSIAQPAAAPSR